MNDSSDDSTDNFRSSFKYYKKKSPPPDLTEVIDFSILSATEHQLPTGVTRVQLIEPAVLKPGCLTHVHSWQAYTLNDHPGFIFITNPFVSGYERYWVKRCLNDYTQPPNHSNLDDLVGSDKWMNVWQSSFSTDSKVNTLLDRLRWVTLGLHHNWNTKEYCVEESSDMPLDVSLLSQYVTSALGFVHFLPEAAILNYYHLDSTLGGHTDHSEFNYEAPLVSISFGCSAVFLLGGPTKAVKPVATFIDSGDIVVMSGPSRLSYHAVPRIMSSVSRPKTYGSCVLSSSGDTTSSRNVPAQSNKSHLVDGALAQQRELKCSFTRESVGASSRVQVIKPLCQYSKDTVDALISSLNSEMDEVLETTDWSPFERFLSKRRINFNVRQVFKKETETAVDRVAQIDCLK